VISERKNWFNSFDFATKPHNQMNKDRHFLAAAGDSSYCGLSKHADGESRVNS
jgi:hypothetical protein